MDTHVPKACGTKHMLSLQQGPDYLRQCFVKHATFGEHEIPFCFQTGPAGESLPFETVQRYGSEHKMPFNDSNGHVMWTVKVDSAAKCASSETTLPCDGATSPAPSDSTRPEGASLAASGDQVCAPGLESRVSLERMLSA